MFDACDTIPIGNTHIHGQPPLLGDAHLGLRWNFGENRPKGDNWEWWTRCNCFRCMTNLTLWTCWMKKPRWSKSWRENHSYILQESSSFRVLKKWNPVLRGLLKGVGHLRRCFSLQNTKVKKQKLAEYVFWHMVGIWFAMFSFLKDTFFCGPRR